MSRLFAYLYVKLSLFQIVEIKIHTDRMPKKSNFPDFDPLDRPIDTVSRFLVF